jgi:uncharacterized protein YuzE
MSKISYDQKVKILSIRLKEGKIADTDVQKNCIIDYDKDGEIINIDILDSNLEKILTKNKNP